MKQNTLVWGRRLGAVAAAGLLYACAANSEGDGEEGPVDGVAQSIGSAAGAQATYGEASYHAPSSTLSGPPNATKMELSGSPFRASTAFVQNLDPGKAVPVYPIENGLLLFAPTGLGRMLGWAWGGLRGLWGSLWVTREAAPPLVAAVRPLVYNRAVDATNINNAYGLARQLTLEEGVAQIAANKVKGIAGPGLAPIDDINRLVRTYGVDPARTWKVRADVMSHRAYPTSVVGRTGAWNEEVMSVHAYRDQFGRVLEPKVKDDLVTHLGTFCGRDC